MAEPTAEAPPEEPQAPEVPEEAAVGGSEAGKAANGALRSLSRAARAFSMYDARNEAIRRFLGDFKEKAERFLASYGPLTLEVRPFEMTLGEEVVYREEDRERSLSFRLFRDGVRELTLNPGVSWDELLKLLEILSVRFVGVRQQEDDIVTLLTKASFQGIAFSAVEGFVAQHEDEDANTSFANARTVQSELTVAAPTDFDRPYPQPLEQRPFGYREVPERFLEPIRAEETAATIPAGALRLVAELIDAAQRGRLPLEELVSPLAEVRDFFVADRKLAETLAWAKQVALLQGAAKEKLGPLLAALLQPENLDKLLEAAQPDPAAPALGELLALVPGKHAAQLVAKVPTAEPESLPVLRALLVRFGKAEPEALLAPLKAAAPPVALLLLEVLLEVAPASALDAAKQLAEHPEPAVQVKVVDLLQKLPRNSDATELLLKVLASPGEEVRVRVMQVLAERAEARAFDPLVRSLEERGEALSVAEREAIGETLARLSPQTALPLFTGWVKPKGSLLKRVMETPAQKAQQFAAVSGLGVMKGEEPEALIKDLSARSDDEALKQHCVQAMVKRRRGMKRG